MPGRAHSGAPEPVAGGLVVAWLLPVGNKSGFHPGDVRAMFGIRSTDATRSGAIGLAARKSRSGERELVSLAVGAELALVRRKVP